MQEKKYYTLGKHGELDSLQLKVSNNSDNLGPSKEQSDEMLERESSRYEHIRGPDYENLIKLGCWVTGSMMAVAIVIVLGGR